MCLELYGIHHLVPQATLHNEVVINVECGQRMYTSVSFCDISSLSVSLLQPAVDLSDTLSSVGTSVREHPAVE